MKKEWTKWWKDKEERGEIKEVEEEEMEEGMEDEEWDDYADDYYGGYNYGFDRKINKKEEEDTKFDWNKWKSTGSKWYGYSYYKEATLDYGYIEKMANLFASKYDITVVPGSSTAINIKTKTFYYNPTNLMFETKASLIAIILHEIGHLLHTTHYDDLKSPYLDKYTNPARLVVNAFEDFRIDDIMSKSYDWSEEIYEAMIPIVKEVAEGYKKKGEEMEVRNVRAIKELEDMIEDVNDSDSMDKDKKKELVKHLKELIKERKEEGNLMDYLMGISLEGYDQPVKNTHKRIQDMIDKTKHAIPMVVEAKTTQEVTDILDKEVFPVIEDLLKSAKNKEGGTEQKDGDVNPIVQASEEDGMGHVDRRGGDNKSNQQKVSGRNPGNEGQVPQEWVEGDYNELLNSVKGVVNYFIRKLKKIRSRDLTVRYERKQRRGKLDIRRAYQYRLGNNRLFKKELENVDRIQDFAFSINLDMSGSMEGSNLVHSTRAVILLSEVFEKLNIPFEIIGWASWRKEIKGFEDSLKKRKKDIAGLPQNQLGGTVISYAFKGDDIAKRPEKKKFMIVLTDGEIGSVDYPLDKLKEWKQKYSADVKVIGIKIQEEDEYYGEGGDERMKELCKEKFIELDEPSNLPDKFSEILKDIIEKRLK